MAKYLFQGSYTEQGLKGLLKEGGSGRVKAVEQMFKGLGGKLEVYYWAYGSDDFFIVADLPDSVSAIAASLIVNAAGAVKVRTTVLITPEELDRASKVTVNYRPPGQ
ncbi:MAG: GYD domain-containing protein [Chloroflexi bacterium]|nr:GYD domain-containing protein [Chloroflexota bacterium]